MAFRNPYRWKNRRRRILQQLDAAIDYHTYMTSKYDYYLNFYRTKKPKGWKKLYKDYSQKFDLENKNRIEAWDYWDSLHNVN